MNVIVRKLNSLTDLGAIYSSWANGAFYSATVPITKAKKEWFEEYHAYVKEQVKHARVLIACLNDDHDTIIGFSVVNGTTLEWISIKWEYREQGIAKLLLKNQHITKVNKNNLTKVGQAVLNKHPELDQGEEHGKTVQESDAISNASNSRKSSE